MPNSGQVASSFNLQWQYIDQPLDYVSATLEILTPPSVAQLYYWALQVTFANGDGAHCGLQWHPFSDVDKAVNWGGYGGGGELLGSPIQFPSADNNPNTGVFDWQVGTKYVFEIIRTADGWLAKVNGQEIRTLYQTDQSCNSPLLFSEVFAECGDPSVEVRWSDLTAYSLSGKTYKTRSVVAAYNADACPNVNSRVDGKLGFRQTTTTTRVNQQGALLRLEEPMHTVDVGVPAGAIGSTGRGSYDTGLPWPQFTGLKPTINGDPNNPPTTANEVEPCNFNNQVRLMFGLFTGNARPTVRVAMWD